MGIEQRLAVLLENCSSGLWIISKVSYGVRFLKAGTVSHCHIEDAANQLIQSYERLVQSDQMGHIFKAIAIAPEAQDVPVGFTV